jgi:hypothetical protein
LHVTYSIHDGEGPGSKRSKENLKLPSISRAKITGRSRDMTWETKYQSKRVIEQKDEEMSILGPYVP